MFTQAYCYEAEIKQMCNIVISPETVNPLILQSMFSRYSKPKNGASINNNNKWYYVAQDSSFFILWVSVTCTTNISVTLPEEALQPIF